MSDTYAQQAEQEIWDAIAKAVPDEPHPRTGPTSCHQCQSTAIVYDERIHDTFVYCQDCGAIQ